MTAVEVLLSRYLTVAKRVHLSGLQAEGYVVQEVFLDSGLPQLLKGLLAHVIGFDVSNAYEQLGTELLVENELLGESLVAKMELARLTSVDEYRKKIESRYKEAVDSLSAQEIDSDRKIAIKARVFCSARSFYKDVANQNHLFTRDGNVESSRVSILHEPCVNVPST